MSENLESDKPQAEPRVNILLVDDQPANLLSLRAILDELDQNIVEALSGDDALRSLLRDDFAVVVLDVQMPGLGGFETAKLIRGRKNSRHTPIIFITAFESDRLQVERAYALGAVDFLVKPIVPIILRAKVAGFVELLKKTQQIQRQAEQIRQLERTDFERRLAEENARFSRFMQHLPGLAWIKDLKGRYVYANDAAERAFRTPRDKLYGNTDEDVFPPATAAQFKQNDEQALTNASGVQVIETLQDETGDLRHSLVSKFPILDAQGKPMLVGGMAIDITDRLRAEEALKEADQHKNEFLATLAHELRNPLAPVRNSLEIMKRANNNLELTEQALSTMERQIGQMVRLIDDLLDVSRITRNRIQLRQERIELASVIEHAVEVCRPLCDSAGLELNVLVPTKPIILHADPVRLAQVFGNLLTNACKYTEAGGRIGLTVERQESDVIVSVKDTGVGISSEMLPKVFEMFTQVDRSLERSQGGLGIGLTLVKRLVELHEGAVTAHSEGIGQGSEFVVRLPVFAEQPKVQPSPVSTVERVPTSSRRILVVDDNRDAAVSLATLLRVNGNETQTVYDGVEAVETAATYKPDVIFLDLGMPNMNGYDACRAIRKQPAGKGILIFALTGWGQDEDRQKSTEAGFNGHLVKPVEYAVLSKLLAASVSK
jgi:PAS domain S-box-containing protein